MNKSGITLFSFKYFLTKYFNKSSNSFPFSEIPELQQSFHDPRVSFLEQNFSSLESRENWIAVNTFPNLGKRLNPDYQDENPWLDLVYLN